MRLSLCGCFLQLIIPSGLSHGPSYYDGVYHSAALWIEASWRTVIGYYDFFLSSESMANAVTQDTYVFRQMSQIQLGFRLVTMTTEMAVFHRFRAFGYEVISNAQLIQWRTSERWAEKLSGVVNPVAGPKQFSILVVDAQGDRCFCRM